MVNVENMDLPKYIRQRSGHTDRKNAKMGTETEKTQKWGQTKAQSINSHKNI